jgi:dimeric dUTPase (all-alpha-NTP-PPase superfamily)
LNLNELFEIQAKLDAHIEKEHPRQPGEDRLSKKILALQVELGELANELPEVFKFWSNKKNNYEKALEEFVDCLHFVLSIGLEIGVCPDELDEEPIFCADVTEQFIDLFYDVSRLKYEERNGQLYEDYYQYNFVLEQFLGLGKLLGFTWKQVEQAYLAKNKINHQRQDSGVY